MRISETFRTSLSIAFEALLANKTRSFLTALGVIFGVAAVIAMMAIGRGTEQEVLEQIEVVGVNNIVVLPVFEENKESELGEVAEEKQSAKRYSPGLTLKDAESIRDVLPEVEDISPEIIVESNIVKSGRSAKGRLVGVEPFFFEIGNFKLAQGNYFNDYQRINGEQVCIIGHDVKTLFFSQEDPMGKYIKVGSLWLKVVGVMAPRQFSQKSLAEMGVRNFNTDIYTPIRTVLIRYKDRAKINPGEDLGDVDEEEEVKPKNYHQLDKLTIKVHSTERLAQAAEVVGRLLKRKHFGVEDYRIVVPELLLEQQQATQRVFRIVLILIAAISLVIGGIGIMNIMLASILERIKEIGLRQAVGARKNDIIQQFLLEAVLLSFSGGILGVILGVTIAVSVEYFAGIVTIVSVWAILISFVVSMLVGLVFGILPAKRAAEQSPINSLRYE